jgi:hypothetical protein
MKRLINVVLLYMMLMTGCEDLTPTRNMPTVSVSVSDIGETSAVCHLSVTPKGATQKSGVIYSTDSSLQTGTSEATTSGSEADVVTLSSLDDGTIYYLRPYAADRLNARVYGDIQTFTTVKVTTLGLSLSSINALSSAGSYKLTISCNDAWTIASNQSWCTVQPTSGTGNGEVTVSVQENTIPDDRSAVLMVTSGSISKQTNLLQQKATTLNLSPSSIDAASIAGAYKLTISCNDAWTVASNQSWCTVQPTSGTGNSEVTVSVQENTTSNDRSAILTVTSGNISKQVNLLQQWITLTEFGNGITAASSFGGGNGTQSSPYLISDARHLKKLVDEYSSGYFKLTIDIRVTANEWIPIRNFSGVFDGDGHTISGTLRSGNYTNYGFFGNTYNATISNLNIAATVESRYNSTGDSYTGSLAGYMDGSNVRNCSISGSVTGGTGGRSLTGGMMGHNDGSMVRDCSVSATVKGGRATRVEYQGNVYPFGDSYTGGVAGRMWNNPVEILNCTVSGSVIGGDATGYSITGGIAGSTGWIVGHTRVSITNCTVSASGSVTAGDSLGDGNVETGGIVGWLGGEEDVINGCTNNASVTGRKTRTGGLVGFHFGKIHASLNTGNVTDLSSGNAKGLVSDNRGYVYSCCTNRGNVNGQPANSENQIGILSGGGATTSLTPCPDGHTKR